MIATPAQRTESPPEILFERRGAVEVVTLNRPRALNALTQGMCEALCRRLAACETDPGCAALLVKGAGERAFCAGGDVRAVAVAAQRGDPLTRTFFRAEYRLNRRIFHFPKAYVALADGVAMGGGVGISAHGSALVATERTLFAMPETGIGLFPDVGASHLLAHLPGRIGLYLGLTGARMNAADCLYTGVATHNVESAALAALEDALVAAAWQGDPARDATEVIGRFAGDPGEAPLAAHREAIDRCFDAGSVEEVFEKLAAEGTDWARETLALLETRSPTSLKISFRSIGEGARLDFDAVMVMEYRLSQACVAAPDFVEGIRAVLVDKDHAPSWRPDRLADVAQETLDAAFAPLGARDLTFD